MVGVSGLGLGLGGKIEWEVGECLLVLGPDLAAPQPVLLDAAELMQPDRRLQVRHVVLEAELDD